ncbi:hypothetical protein ACFOGJ_26475 [Marinibaculum pumilum]|uniref:Cytochrome c domain-containing protein n=1 Tax=Marinibaculum pumilum TaxID=1766165 RepID=A0ABV7L8X5_9PROT
MRFPRSPIRRAALACAAAAVMSGPAVAQDAQGDPVAGAAIARDVCASCHAVAPGEMDAPMVEAPPFQAVADAPGMTEMALYAWMTSSHPTMPNIMLDRGALRDVVAYVLSLRTEGEGG